MEETVVAAETFAAFFEKSAGSEASGYLVDHTSSFSVIDKQGNWRVLYSFETPPADIAADMRILISE